jgi:hypothetical protein
MVSAPGQALASMIAARNVQPPPPLAAQVQSPRLPPSYAKSEVLLTVKSAAKTGADVAINHIPATSTAVEIATPLLNIDCVFMTAFSILEWKFHIDIDLFNKQRLIPYESIVFLITWRRVAFMT